MWLYLLAFAFIAFIIVKGLMAQSDPTKSFILKPTAYMHLKRGIRFDLEEDIMNPDSLIKYDLNTNQPYVIRRTGAFDKGDKKIPLEEGKYMDFDFIGFRIILDGIDALNAQLIDDIVDKDRQILNLTNMTASQEGRILDLENKLEDVLGKRVEFTEKQNIASRKGIVMKQPNQR